MVRHQHTAQRGSSGQAIVLMALTLGAIMAFVALALDGAHFLSQRRAAQNAADMAALAGVYMYASNPDIVNGQQVLSEINRVAELNNIADTDGVAGNGVDGNVQAWWVDKTGTDITTINNDASQLAPSNTAAVRVQTQIPYDTFIGGFIGHARVQTQASGIARVSIQYKLRTDDTSSIWTAGSDCDNLTDRIAHNYADTNTAKFLSSVYVDGSLAVGSVNSTDFYGNVQVRVVTGIGGIGGPYTASVGDPFSGGGNKYHNSAKYIGPNSPASPSKGFPTWAMISTPDGSTHQLSAADFRPVAPIGEMYRRYTWFLRWGLAPADFYHYVTGDPSNAPGTIAAPAIDLLYNAGARGIFYIDGDLTIPAGTQSWQGVTLIVNGRFNNVDPNHDFWTAGWTASGQDPKVSGLAKNISVLAGADLGGNRRCASDSSNWVFNADNNNTQFHGLVYVPFGQIYFHGNTSGGSASPQFSQGVVTYSVYLDGNSWQFQFNPALFVDPLPATELNN